MASDDDRQLLRRGLTRRRFLPGIGASVAGLALGGRDPSQPDWYGVLDPTWSFAASQPMMAKLATIQ